MKHALRCRRNYYGLEQLTARVMFEEQARIGLASVNVGYDGRPEEFVINNKDIRTGLCVEMIGGTRTSSSFSAHACSELKRHVQTHTAAHDTQPLQ